jgi:cysteinyl-tRNA synthetase
LALKLYNTLTRQKSEFVPIDPKNVRMYVCGPTVYDYAHIGNARPVIVFDLLFRLLRFLFGADHVTYVRNITDVDDKINARAARDYPDLPLNEAIRKVTEATEAQFHKDIAALGVLPPTYEPRATEYIRRPQGGEDMVSLIEKLVANGHAYVAADHVLFDVASMPDYGRLSNRSLDEMEAGARVEVAPYKKGPMDFVLWKPSKPGEPAWPSPAGIATPGRPGWHIECSAMAGALLGPVFDIHGGGIDLTFPHHENEIAQSRCAHATSVMANVWMHNGFLQVEGEKMSKSLGNFITINELLTTDKFGGQRWSGDVLRMTMLRTHYRQPIDWTVAALRENQKVWASIGNLIRDHAEAEEYDDDFLSALRDDLNTPAAFARLFELRDAAAAGDESAAQKLRKAFKLLGFLREWEFKEEIVVPTHGPLDLTDIIPRIFETNGDIELDAWATHFEHNYGENAQNISAFLRRFCPGTTVRAIQPIKSSWPNLIQLTNQRLEARKRKDFQESDRIRDELEKIGIALKDTKNKETGEIETTWEVAR